VVSVMTTWKRGRTALVRMMQKRFMPIGDFVNIVTRQKPHRIDGVGIFMTSNPRVTPPALHHHYTHNQVLHQRVVLLSIVTEDVPVIPARDAIEIGDLGAGFYEVVARFGFMQHPKVEKILRLVRAKTGHRTEENRTTYYLGRDV